jgi:hypothetical protein
MGSILIYGDSDDARPIGAKDSSVDIMWMEKRGGEWVFANEVPAFQDVQDVQLLGRAWDRRAVWVTRNNGLIEKGHHVVIAIHPYHADFCQHAPFKPPSKKGEMGRKPTGQRFATVAEARLWIDSLTYDYWETHDYLTASLPLTRRERSWQERRPAHNHRLVFGACANSDEVRRDLLLHPHVAKLIELTENGTIRFRPIGTGVPKLSESLRSRSDELMTQAIAYAMAGPPKDSDRWFNEPVVKLVEYVYKGLLHKHHRRGEP